MSKLYRSTGMDEEWLATGMKSSDYWHKNGRQFAREQMITGTKMKRERNVSGVFIPCLCLYGDDQVLYTYTNSMIYTIFSGCFL